MKSTMQKSPITRLRGRLIYQILAGFLISLFSLFPALGQDKNPIPLQSRTLIPPEEQIQLAEGAAPEDITKQIDAAYKTGRFKAPAKPGFAYMLSIEAKVFDPESKKIIIPPPHLMFYAPYLTSKDLGGQIGAHMPLLLWGGRPDTFIIVVPAFMCAGDGAKIWQCPRP